MADRRFQGKRVSREWDIVLTEADKYLDLRLNSGQRTMSEQTFLWRNRGKPGFAKLVAFPTPWAPHIRVGRVDHALDVDTNVGDGEDELQRWLLHDLGLATNNTVRGEPWHLEAVSAAALKRAAARVVKRRLDRSPTIRRGTVNPDAVRKLQVLLRGAHVKGVPLNGKYDLRTRRGVRRFQKKHGIRPDGKTTVGDRTWAALRKVVS